ncbi:MAG: GvpL/GvpF family gas vesicle protein, partial [Dehalococcoidales bacterium]|nr:GvpL/GvpF family gas vesicle protein [Dehalococcoidales bacterium]
MQKQGKHLYGVIKEREKKDFGLIGVGERQDKVYTIHHKELAAVVSDVPMVAYSSLPQETVVRYLASHQYVIEQVMKSYTIVPIKFGTIAQVEAEVRQILERGYSQFNDALEAMSDKIELDVVATWANLDSVLKEIGEEEKIKRFRREAATKPPAETQAAKIELGKMIKLVLDDRRMETASEIVDALKECAIDYWPHEVMDDTMIMNVAFLIPRNKEREFDERVNQLNESYQERVNFRCVGPLPPYSFRTMEVKRMTFDEVDAARKILGLGEEATLSDIKDSYRNLARRFHPDQHPGDPEAQKQFEKITKAYRLLLDYCQKEWCSFTQEDVTNFMLIRVL